MEHLPSDRPLLKISDVAQATGIACANLRAWERRYGFPATARTQGGQRLYSMAQVEELRRLQDLLDRGLAVSQAVGLLNGHRAPLDPCEIDDELAGSLFDALLAMRRSEADDILERAGAACPCGLVVDRLLVPVMRRIGDDWRAGVVGIDQEHFATTWAREWMTLQLARMPRPTGARLLLACVEGERHELGLFALQIALRAENFETLHLGADVPTVALVAAIRRFRPRAVLLSTSCPERLAAVPEVVRAIGEIPPDRRPRVVYGGCCTGGTVAVAGAEWLGGSAADVAAALADWLEQPASEASTNLG